MTDDPIVRCTDLRKEFAAVTAVDDLTIDIHDEFTSVIGPNGAGKTTTFNLLAGTLSPTAGRMELNGTDVTAKGPESRVHHGLSRTYQITNLFDELPAFENVRLAVQAVSDVPYANVFADALSDQEINRRTTEILDLVGFEEDRTTAAENLSQGYKRLLEIAIALAPEPDVLLLDEPTAGLAVDKKELVFDVVGDLADEYAVVLIEHKLDVVRDMSDRLVVMHNGQVLDSGPPEETLSNPEVQEAYLRGVTS
ncbi:ABC transporter ATP-binding protein [Haloarchaeobius iranensis]|uniref:Branched-chain amino acid transport system ATP-binding protein n=1 Tax=Haloarchaeobius iranensis TaxID=996166 RepID=A0A1G9Z9M0_9EURY|nr:ABC transporter ATP-binding protein [Haloarchaeobius iranensis]SDN18049.1 branched-chain amino acid transport system ATP-binding protein [Haloarchaeobius iranensis]